MRYGLAMRLFLGHMTALRAWRRIRQGKLPWPRAVTCQTCAHSLGNAGDLHALVSGDKQASRREGAGGHREGAGGHRSVSREETIPLLLRTCSTHPLTGTGKLDLLVPDRSQRHRLKGIRHHLLTGTLPPGSFMMVSDGVYLPSTELLFLLLAGALTQWELIAVGHELCGNYCIDATHENGFVPFLEPVSSTDSIKEYLGKVKGRRYVRRACEAIRHVRDGSLSPRETDLATALALPATQGGYWMGDFALNAPLTFLGEDSRIVGSGLRYPDLLFSARPVICEYDSRLHHGERSSSDRDKDRADGLRAVGYSVVTFSSLHFRRRGDFLRAMRRVARYMGADIMGTENDPDVARARLSLFEWMRHPRHQPL